MARYPTTGGTGSDKTFVFPQVSAASTWVIAHGMGKNPSVLVLEGAGNEVEGDIVYDSLNQLTINFNGTNVAGHAYLN